MNWDTVLADMAAKVDELEQRLEAGVWDDLDEMPFAPPEVEGEMTTAQRARAVSLLERVAACRKRLEGGMDQTRQELADVDNRKRGARQYARSDMSHSA